MPPGRVTGLVNESTQRRKERKGVLLLKPYSFLFFITSRRHHPLLIGQKLTG
jgi:hypothetical protein